jgi:HAD superfamily hydrolase (TIGR01509 family)
VGQFRKKGVGYPIAMSKAAILDVDGTLVDTNYHHAIAWWRAFKQHDILVPIWRIHRSIGMGGDKMIAALCGDDVEEEKGDDIRDAEKALYLALIEEVVLLEGARDLITALKDRGHAVVLASSAKSNELDHYLDQLDARDLVDDWTDSSDVDDTKPDPDLVKAAMKKAGTGDAVMVGDSVWDCRAAERAGIETIAVLTGGFSEDELREAGATAVFKSLPQLIEGLDGTSLR